MQHGRGDFESDGPAIPEGAKKVHGEDCLEDRADEGGAHTDAEELAEEVVARGVDAVENDCDVGEEFGDDVEGTYKLISSNQSIERRGTSYPILCTE